MSDESATVALLEQTRALREQFVRPIYLSLLNANFMRKPEVGSGLPRRTESESAALRAQINVAARSISDEQIRTLLSVPEWRGRLVAAWLVGLSKRIEFVDEIANHLIASKMVYAGQGYCVALGLIGNERCRQYLRAYLSEYLPLRGRIFDQTWAIGALAYVEGSPPEEFLLPELWDDRKVHLDTSHGIQKFSELVDYLNTHQMIAGSNDHPLSSPKEQS